MTFAIDTGSAPEAPVAKSATIDGSIDLAAQPEWAERAHRQIIEALQCCETLEQIEEYWKAETLLLDAFYMAYPEYWDRIKEAYDDCRILVDPKAKLPHGNADPAEPGNSLGIAF